ncbi:hypothetical protein PIROE2DRAFT_57191 [Piromyces sp. E2]|nr:hypothetical protein PIROE2DRAFT_57191 [Piromyces sp. E2]|eukprot:OUM69759.1 hypothetical protein PIROE2DRAFT_57191 [Piromyces sp. E2]
MFGKKILSLVGVLFLGSQIASVNAACQITISGCPGDCQCELGSSHDTCQNGYYAVAAGDGANKTPNSGITDGLLIKFSGDNVGDDCNVITDNGYYKSLETNKYIVKGASGANMITAGNGCTAGKVDSEDGYKFCLDGTAGDGTNKISWNDGNYYLVDTTTADVFTGDTNGVAVVVSKDDAIVDAGLTNDSKNYLVINKKASYGTPTTAVDQIIAVTNGGTDLGKVTAGFSDGDDYCVSDATKQITPKIDNFCNSALSSVDCDQYYTYESTGGTFSIEIPKRTVKTCTGIIGLTSCSDGDYYIVSAGSLQQTPSGTGQLYKCVEETTNNVVCRKDLSTVGYLKNSDGVKNDSGDKTIPYIQCNALASGGNGVDTSNEDNCIALEALGQVDGCTASDVGKLIKTVGGYQLCIDASTPKPLATPGNFLVDASKASTFETTGTGADSGYFVVAQLGNDHAIRKPQDMKKYIYASAKQVYTKSDSGAYDAICQSTTTLKDAKEYILNKDVDSPATVDHVDYYKLNNN